MDSGFEVGRAPNLYGNIAVIFRFGTCPTGMRAISFIDLMSITDTLFRLSVGNVSGLVVGCQGNPVRSPADLNRSQQLQVWKRIHINRAVEPAVDHQHLSV